MEGYVLEKNRPFEILGLSFSSKLDLSSYIVSLYEVLFFVVVLYIFKSIIGPYLEYHCHVWASARSCYLVILNKLQKQVSRTIWLINEI